MALEEVITWEIEEVGNQWQSVAISGNQWQSVAIEEVITWVIEEVSEEVRGRIALGTARVRVAHTCRDRSRRSERRSSWHGS